MRPSPLRPVVRGSAFGRVDPVLCFIALATNLAVLASAIVERQPAPPPVVHGEVSVTPAPRRAFGLTARGAHAFELLRTTSVFAGAQVGFAGLPSAQARAMRVLLQEQDPDVVFARLMGYAETPAARLYGLLGLTLTDPTAYRKARVLFALEETSVPSQFGCIGGEISVGALVRLIDRGDLSREFLGDSTTARMDALVDSLEASRRPTVADALDRGRRSAF